MKNQRFFTFYLSSNASVAFVMHGVYDEQKRKMRCQGKPGRGGFANRLRIVTIGLEER